ncbi:MAG: carbohydrate ABC transporter permease [Clostridia bacterium]|nr:carbohydrate ABC transporter permease [Clostridiales bacterium]MDO4827921.1 carbohydrate ABC transporter permease [Clostridia bacterium]
MTQSIAHSKPRNRVRLSRQDKTYYSVVYTLVTLLTLIVLLPLTNVLACSFSAPESVASGKVLLWPVNFSVSGYERVFNTDEIWIGYANTLYYTIVGTFVNVFVTMICAYPLARRGLPYKSFFSFLFAFTMLFSGGLVPTYLLARNLHLLNTRWALIIPGAMGVYQMIVTRTFLVANIPQELLEMSQIDGCNDFRFFWSFVLPLSKAVIAVTAMQYAVGHWNSWFSAFLYLSDDKKYPLQMMLRRILVMNQIKASDYVDEETLVAMEGMADLLKYSLIVVATVPILCAYPFIQKYFVKGIMIGSLKG